MEQLTQGEKYEEMDSEDNATEEQSEDTSFHLDTIMGLPKNIVVVGGLIALIIVLALVLAVSKKVKDKKENVVTTLPTDEEFSLPNEEFSESAVVNENITMYGDTPAVEETDESIELNSTETEILLRKYGYSGDEIDYAISHNINIDALVEDAKMLQQEAAREALAAVSDTASDAYKTLLDYTYLGEEEFTVEDQSVLQVENQVIKEETVIRNIDYVKCPTRGSQLFLKCKIDADTDYWYQVTPERWCALPASGNIVLKYIVTTYGSHDYITYAVEQDSSLITVDSSALKEEFVSQETTDEVEEVEENGSDEVQQQDPEVGE